MKKSGTIFSIEENLPEPEPISRPTPPMVEGDLSATTQALISAYQASFLQPRKGEVSLIHVDEIAFKVASFYEKIRKIVDWKEEHLIRRTAIERILKRRMIAELSQFKLVPDLKAAVIAEPLVLELIRGGHLANDQIPQAKVKEVEKILEKYVYLLQNNALASRSASKIKEKVNFYNWLLEIAACEIEETLAPPLRENALIESMTEVMTARIKVIPLGVMGDKEKRVQTFIAVHKALFRLDEPIISYRLLKHHLPEWSHLSPSMSVLKGITANIFTLKQKVEEDLSHPLGGEFFKVCEKYDTIWLLLSDVLNLLTKDKIQIPEKILSEENFNHFVKEAYKVRLSTLKSRLYRMAIYSTLSIFIASGLSLFVVEVPLAKLFYGRFNFLAIMVDILFPTLLMFLLVAAVKPPSEANFKLALAEIKKIVYPTDEKDVYEIDARKRRKTLLALIVGLLYLLGSLISVVATIFLFYFARVPVTSIILDTLNVALVVFAGLVIRQRAKELTVEEKTSFLEFSLDILSVPLAKIGQWLARKWKEYNIVSVFFTALVDMPFLAFIGFLEGWSSFLKEKKAEIH